MSKSYGHRLLSVAHAILADCMGIFPEDQKELKRDIDRLSVLVETRGLAVLTVDLPALLKHLDRCLSLGTYTRSGLACSSPRWKSSPIPKLFSGLMIRVFDKSGMLRFDADVNAVASLRQLYAVGKKLRIDCKEEKTYEAISTFFDIEGTLPAPTLDWADSWGDHWVENNHSFCDLHPRGRFRGPDCLGLRGEYNRLAMAQQVADVIATSLGQFDPWEWRPKHGPGAVSDLKAGENKYVFPTWTEKLESVFPFADFAFANHSLWADGAAEAAVGFDDEPSSRLICVPKTQKGPRLIAAEPTSHQWCQQVIWDYFDRRVSALYLAESIHFRDQTHNQELARLASGSGSHWTVDLSSASDYLGLWDVERFFRRNPSLLRALCASRTRFLSQKLDSKHPERIELKKLSTMGSACTFPVQSIVFLGITVASVLYSRGWSPSLQNVKRACKEIRVFGDDIIVPSDCGRTLLDNLRSLNFKANAEKTFRTGYFRESCGMDAFRGHDVTPAYVTQFSSTRKPESVLATVTLSNNFFLKGWWRAAEAIQQTVATIQLPVVHPESGVVGWTSYCGSKVTSKVRWNEDLQREEYRADMLKVSVRKVPSDDNTAYLQYFTEDPDPGLPWQSGATQRPRITLRRGWAAVRGLLH